MADTKTTFQGTPSLTDRELVTGTVQGQVVRSLWKSIVLILVLTGLFVAYLLIKPGGPKSLNFGDNVLQGLLEMVGLLLTLPPLKRRERLQVPFNGCVASTNTTQRWVPFFLCLAILSYVIGQVIWTYNEDIAHLAVLFPTWADAGYLCSYPFVLLALLFLPTRPLTTDARIRIALDSLMIMVGITTFSWYFILGPTVLQGADTVLGRIIGTAYPLATLGLIFCLLLLVLYSHDQLIRPVVLILGLAFIVIVATDSIYDYQELHNMYATGTLLDVGWPLGYMLMGLGARALGESMIVGNGSIPTRVPLTGVEKPITASTLWRSMLPYIFVPFVILLLAYAVAVPRDMPLKLGVFLGTAMLMGLLILRQFFALRETLGQHQKLWEMREQVIEADLARERAERLKAERILALNEALTNSKQTEPHTRIIAFGHYQVRDSKGVYHDVYLREVGTRQVFECACEQYRHAAICPHSLAAAVLHSASDPA